jgi:hypothetical protein
MTMTDQSNANTNTQSSENPLTEEFATFVKETLDEWKVPGVSLAVIDGDDIYAEVPRQPSLKRSTYTDTGS